MNYRRFLEDEYKQSGKQPVYCTIGTQRITVPPAYKGNIDGFVDDIFSYENETAKYRQYNESQVLEKDKFDVCMLKSGNISFLPPFDLYVKNLPSDEIIKRSIRRALRRYKSAIKKVLRAQKEYPEKSFPVRMDNDYLNKLDVLHRKYVVNKIGYHFAKISKWSAAQTVNIIAGAAGALPLAAYYMLDKKVHFADTKGHRFIKEHAAPYIRKGLMKGLIPVGLAAGMQPFTRTVASNKSAQQALSVVVDNSDDKEKISDDSKTAQFEFSQSAKKYNITDKESFDRLFNDAFSEIAQSMMPTEILVLEPYSDNGKVTNTYGLGSYYVPESGNPQDADWIKTSTYIKNNKELPAEGKYALELMNGWFKYRDNGRIYKEMYKRLKGAQLTVSEFTAICTCTYNDEKNGKKFCDFVRKNYRDPIKCAGFLMQLKPGNSQFNDGILKRHTHEALTYLNMGNYCDKIPYFFVKEGINSKGKKYYVTSVSQLKPEVCQKMSDDLAEGKLDSAKEVQKSILSYHCKGGQTVYEICQKNGLSFLFEGKNALDENEMNKVMSVDNLYAEALNNYQNEKYAEALSGFKKIVSQGYSSADIHNDMAITYYKMGQYDDCIRECQEILKTGETDQYAPANFNAALAYEKKGNTKKALENYRLALKREPDVKAYQNAVNRLTLPARVNQPTR